MQLQGTLELSELPITASNFGVFAANIKVLYMKAEMENISFTLFLLSYLIWIANGK